MKVVGLRPRAREDLREVKRWYAEQQAGLDQRFGAHLDELIGRIAKHPQLYQQIDDGVRRVSAVGPFPYSVYYREIGDRIEILAVLHNARHPDAWRERSS
jgi:plasmid stabilization system protein ParE